jgi:hypothetical protein
MELLWPRKKHSRRGKKEIKKQPPYTTLLDEIKAIPNLQNKCYTTRSEIGCCIFLLINAPKR